jgi:hypothetical protein
MRNQMRRRMKKNEIVRELKQMKVTKKKVAKK